MNSKINDIEIETTQTLDTMLLQVLNQALVAIAAEAGSLMLLDNKQGILQIKARLGKPRPRRTTEPLYKFEDRTEDGGQGKGRSIAGWVVRNKRSYLCPDVEKDPFFERSRSGKNFSSLLSVPVIHEGKVLAVINADAVEKGYFTESHKKRLEHVARQVATPIAERISVLAALSEIGVELSRLPREGGVEPVLDKIAQLAVRSLGIDVVIIYPYIQERDQFPVEGKGPTIAGEIRDPRFMRKSVYPGDVPWTVVVKERRSGFYSDVLKRNFLTGEVARPDDSPRRRFAVREGIQSMAALLLPFGASGKEDKEVVGVMFANYRTRHEFNIDEVTALATFADYAAVAILNARHAEQRSQERLRNEQIEMIENIAKIFAHRMGNLAGPSRAAAQILRTRVDQEADAMAARQLDILERKAKVLMELADRLIRPFKKTGKMFELGPLDVSHIIEEEIDRIIPVLSNVTVEKDVAEDLPEVQSVEFQLCEVLQDMFNNAIEAMKDQAAGKLTIQARYNEASNRVEVEISDTGSGIQDDVREKLFSPGVTTKSSLGIGLWWSQTFMQATGGALRLKDTRLGEGTSFVMEIPCVSKAKPASPGASATTEAFDVLIVDDDQDWCTTLSDVLSSEGYSTRTASKYSEASRALEEHHFKLAILDVRLVDADPGNKDGLRLLADIDKAGMPTQVIIFTTHGTEIDKRAAEESPRLVEFITKAAFDLSHFTDVVNNALKPVRNRHDHPGGTS